MKRKECVIFVLDVQWFFTGKLFQLDSLSEFGAANLQDKKLEVLNQEMREERPKRSALEVRIDSIESKIMTYRTFFLQKERSPSTIWNMLNPDENLNKLLYPHDVWESYPEITHEVPEERLKRRAEREHHSE